jgi:acrylyl-CoA reductase (NADPH)
MAAIQEPFPALVLEKDAAGFRAQLRALHLTDLPAQGEVLVEVECSSLNYKDGLAVTDRGRIAKAYPIVPGIDLAGTVVDPGGSDLQRGQRVIVTGRGIGEEHWGGYARYARVQAEWTVPMPEGLSPQSAMVIGTAGYTAMLARMTLEDQGLRPGDGEVVVTGASGGVGSMAVALLAAAGHRVVASTGRLEEGDYLRSLGASELIHRRELSEAAPSALRSERWAGAVDTVGGSSLANLISSMRRHGSIAACGLAGGASLNTTVFPFILRGVNLMGIDSNYCPAARRLRAWRSLAQALSPEQLAMMTHAVIGLDGLQEMSQRILDGSVRGRVLVEVGPFRRSPSSA